MKILIYTTQPGWKSWPQKLSAIRGTIGLTRYVGPVTIDLRTFDGTPQVAGGKVSRAWFNTLTIPARKEGYEAVVLHLSEKEGKKLALDGYRGCTINDELTGEIWLLADENTVVKYDDGFEINRFYKVLIHEMSHWLAHLTKTKDNTHYWDYDRHFVMAAFREYELKRSLIATILSAYRKERMRLPLDTMGPISQPFGEKNTLYKSGIHAGCDFALPVGTKIYAPTDGVVSLTWNRHKDLGNAFVFEFYYMGKMYSMRCAHLRDPVKKGGYRAGDILGYTGNTGLSTGPHLHMEIWRGGYNPDMLQSEETVRQALVNPTILFNNYTV